MSSDRCYRRLIQVVISQHKMNPSEDCFIKLGHPISCKEHDAFAICVGAKSAKSDLMVQVLDQDIYLYSIIFL